MHTFKALINKIESKEMANKMKTKLKTTMHTYLSVLILATVLLASQLTTAQTKETIAEKGILVKTNYKQDFANGDKKKLVDKIETFNKKGELIDLKVYNSKGQYAKDWFQYKYDANGRLAKETEYDAKQNLKKRTVFKYDTNGRTSEEIEYYPEGRFKKRTLYKYANGLKISKEVFDEKERLSSKTSYEYQFTK